MMSSIICQGSRKVTQNPKVYKLLSAVGLDLPSPIHAVLVIITGWHNQPHFTLLPPMQHHRSPPLPLPTTFMLGTGAVVLGIQSTSVWRKSKIREKTLRGLGMDTNPAGRLGKTVWLFLPDPRDHGKDQLQRGKGQMRRGGGQRALVWCICTMDAGQCYLALSLGDVTVMQTRYRCFPCISLVTSCLLRNFLRCFTILARAVKILSLKQELIKTIFNADLGSLQVWNKIQGLNQSIKCRFRSLQTHTHTHKRVFSNVRWFQIRSITLVAKRLQNQRMCPNLRSNF